MPTGVLRRGKNQDLICCYSLRFCILFSVAMRLTPAASIRYTLHICRELIFLKNCKWEGKCIQLVRGHTECQLQESKYVCKGNPTKNTSFESTELLMCTMLQHIYSAGDTGPRLILVKKKPQPVR